MDWNWSFKAFRLFDVDVRIHWSLPLFFLYFVMRGTDMGYSLTNQGLFVILPMLTLFACVVAHEYGHVFAARHYSLFVDHMILTPIGGMVMVAQGKTPTHEFVVAVAGPLVNLALALIAAAIYFVVGGSLATELPLVGGDVFMELLARENYLALIMLDVIQINMVLFLFNMLMVAYPLDGGRALTAILWRQRGFHAAVTISCQLARVLAVLLGLYGLVTVQPIICVIAFFVVFQAHTMLQRVDMMPDPGYGYEPRYESAVRQQRRQRQAERRRKKPWFGKAWLQKRRDKRIGALLAKAETHGITALTPEEREYLKRVRESRKKRS